MTLWNFWHTITVIIYYKHQIIHIFYYFITQILYSRRGMDWGKIIDVVPLGN